MSGLSDKERVECTKLLSKMTKEDLRSLCDTVTNRIIDVENDKEALDAILSFSMSAEELLKRRKVYRDMIFKYLAEEEIVMPPTSEKHVLIKRTLELWLSKEVKKPKEKPDDRTERPHTGTLSTDVKPDPGFDPLILGQQFCQWFFGLLNSQNLTLGQEPQDWGPQHFWPDAKLNLLARVAEQQMEEFAGAELISRRLLALTREEQLLLNPNLEPHGLRALASPHGLVLVAVAGTIHRGTSCLGIFEQVFGLIKSPLDNNWKIKFTNLKIRGQDAIAGREVSAPSLTFNSSELQLLCKRV